MDYEYDIKGYPKYGVKNGRIFNKQTEREIKEKTYNGIYFYNLNSQKVRSDKIILVKPQFADCPF